MHPSVSFAAVAALTLVGTTTAQAPSAVLVDSNLDQLFTVDVTTGAASLVTATSGLVTAADLTWRYVTGELWTVDLSGGAVGTIDLLTGAFTPVYQTALSGWQGMAWDETTQKFYLANQSGMNYVLDPATGMTTLLGAAGFSLLTTLETDLAGNLYGIQFSGTPSIVSIDKTTGAGTAIAVAIGGIQGLGIDPMTGTWYAANTNDDSLYRIDPVTGAATLIGANGAGVQFAKGFDVIDFGTLAYNAPRGAGCGGLGLVPHSRPLIGQTWGVDFTGIPATAGIGLVLLGVTNPALPLAPLAPGCTQLSSAELLGAVLFPPGSPAYGLALPPNPLYVGFSIFAQGAALVPGVNPLGVITSNAVEGRIGDT